MKSNKHLEKLILLYFYDELNEEEKTELEVHVEYCENCRKQFEETQALHSHLKNRIQIQPTEKSLTQLRILLQNCLREERRVLLSNSWWQKILDFFYTNQLATQLAGAAAFLFLGILLGSFIWNEKIPETGILPRQAIHDLPEQTQQPFISNIDWLEYDPKTGKVTMSYKSVNDVFVEGNIDDEPVRKLLVHVLRTETHPGRRLTAVKAFGGRESKDSEIENALIYALENDEVDGVRLRAAKVLKTLPSNQKIKEVFIHVLLKDANPAIRIEAVEALSLLKEQKDVMPILQDVSKDDENDFIRLKSSKILERRERPELDQGKNGVQK